MIMLTFAAVELSIYTNSICVKSYIINMGNQTRAVMQYFMLIASTKSMKVNNSFIYLD